MTGCDYILPGFDSDLRPYTTDCSCLLKKNHEDEHVIKLDDGRYAIWIPEHCPDCTNPLCELDGDRCFVWSYISEKEAMERIKKAAQS